MAKKIENMDTDEFVAHIEKLDEDEFLDVWTEYGAAVEESQKRLRLFSQEHQKRTRRAELVRQGFTKADLELLQSVEPEGVESSEAVNTPEDESEDNE